MVENNINKCNKCDNVGGFELGQTIQNPQTYLWEFKAELNLCASCYEKDKKQYWLDYGTIKSKQIKDNLLITHHIKGCGHTGDACIYSDPACHGLGAMKKCGDIFPKKQCKLKLDKWWDERAKVWHYIGSCESPLKTQQEYEAGECKSCQKYKNYNKDNDRERERERERESKFNNLLVN